MEWFVALVLASLLLVAAIGDALRYEISNGLCLVIAGAFAALAYACGMAPADVGMHYLAGLATLAAGFVLFQFGVFGGGDAKLMAATAAWLGFGALPDFAVGVAYAGGALALVALTGRALATPQPHWPQPVSKFLTKGHGVPYGVAIAAGALYALPQSLILRLATGA